jgi:hypothetical protein
MEPVFRWDPVKVGHLHKVALSTGETFTLKTIAMRPVAFQIDDFLTVEECDTAVHSVTHTFVSKGMWRTSNQTWLGQGTKASALMKTLRDRVQEVIRVPTFIMEVLCVHIRIERVIDAVVPLPEYSSVFLSSDLLIFFPQDSEPLQVVEYFPGGHYHAHHDSSQYTPRYLTLLYFLTVTRTVTQTYNRGRYSIRKLLRASRVCLVSLATCSFVPTVIFIILNAPYNTDTIQYSIQLERWHACMCC